MQISLPSSVPASSESVLPVVPPADPTTCQPGQTADGGIPLSFEEFFPPGETAPPSPAEEQCPDTEKTAAILAASFWMPVAAMPITSLPEPPPADPLPGETPGMTDQPPAGRSPFSFSHPGASVRPAVLFAASSARAFASVTYGAAPRELSGPVVAATMANPEPSIPVGTEPVTEPGPMVRIDARRATEPVPECGVSEAVEETPGATVKPAASIPAAVVPQIRAVVPARQQAGDSTQLTAPDPLPKQQPEALGASRPAGGEAIAPTVAGQPDTADRESSRIEVGVPATNFLAPARPANLPRAVQPAVVTSVSDRQTGAVEKFAAGARAISAAVSGAILVEKKDFLSTGRATVSAADPVVGIAVAEVRTDMSATPSNRSKTVTLVESLANVMVTLDQAPAQTPAPAVPVMPAAVRETMAAVVSAVEALERRTDAVQKAVDLQFHVGTERLALRVELRDGTVHTTFRTESSELRTALTHEWQAVMQPVAGRELRLADPVFSAASGPGGDAAQGSLGQGTPQQRGQQPAEPAKFSLPQDFTETATLESGSAPVAAAQPSSLLQAFA